MVIRAAVDVGSNSVLLVVCEKRGDHWLQVAETSEVTGLGRGTKQTGLLTEDAMRETLVAIRRAFAQAKSLGATEVRAGATMAARIATNAADFVQRAKDQGTPIFVLSGQDEADLGFRSVADDPLWAACERLAVIDPGGHSTEIVIAQRSASGFDERFRCSFAVGTLGLRGSVIPSGAPGPAERMAAVAAIDSSLLIEVPEGGCGHCVVVGATGTNLVSIRDHLAEWQPALVHGSKLSLEEISRAAGWLMDMTDEDRRLIVGLEPGREQTIHIGALILERCLYALHSEEVEVSVRGWRHALLASDAPWAAGTATIFGECS